MKKILDKRTEQVQQQSETFRHFICRNCQETALLDMHSVNSSTKCTQCEQGRLLILPLVTPYPAYRPGTRLSPFQKEIRATLRRWKNGWMHEKAQMVVEAGIVASRQYDLSEADMDELFRLCHSKDMPLKVFNWYWRNTLPAFVGAGLSDLHADEATFKQFDSMFEGISKETLKW